MDQMRHIPRPDPGLHILTTPKHHTTTLLASPSDRSDKIRGREAARLAVEASVQDQDFVLLRAGTSDRGADALQDERRDDGRVEAADAVDDGFGDGDGVEDFGVGRGPHFLAVGVDVPEALDARGEGLLGAFGEVDVGLAEGW